MGQQTLAVVKVPINKAWEEKCPWTSKEQHEEELQSVTSHQCLKKAEGMDFINLEFVQIVP